MTIDRLPAIAVFNYSDAGYRLEELQRGEGFVSVEIDEAVFCYIEESYEGEKVPISLANSKEFSVTTNGNKGRLIEVE